MDLKLGNIMIGYGFNLKLIDFDHAMLINEDTELRGRGTVNFRAPELISLKRHQTI